MDLVELKPSRSKTPAGPKPSWLKVKAPGSPQFLETKEIVKSRRLHTVCEEARCPNIGECWSHHTATFMIMGDLCTRKCHFCAVKKGDNSSLSPLDPMEPQRTGLAVKELGLKHIVITSVNRDDIPDMGAHHFKFTVEEIHKQAPECKIELLIPDMQGRRELLEIILSAGVDVLNHNIETVKRLYKKVRPIAVYERSLEILKWVKEISPDTQSKSGIMVGLGEEPSEVEALMDDFRAHDVDIMTIGQYLRPSENQLPVKEFVTPEQFELYRLMGVNKGFRHIESGPLVRSSYHAWKHVK